MTNHRPLETLPVRALYALHRGIGKQAGLIIMYLADGLGRVCAMGSLSSDGLFGYVFDELVHELGLKDDNQCYVDTNCHLVEELNDNFEGTYEERREFMLRHIVGELHIRQLKLPEENTAGTPHRPREKKEEVKA